MKESLNISYSQNFLHSKGLISRLIAKSNIRAGDLVIDIGAGKGIISNVLLYRGCEVIAIEKDAVLAKALPENLAETIKDRPEAVVKPIQADFLNFNLKNLPPFKVFANIPFFLTSAIVRKLCLTDSKLVSAYLVMEAAAAARIIGKPYHTESYLPLILKSQWEMKIRYTFDRFDFIPVPDAEIVLVEFSRQENPVVKKEDFTDYCDFLAFCLNLRKSNVKNSLLDVFTFVQLKKIAIPLKIDLQAPPSTLTLQQWLGLFQNFKTRVDAAKKAQIKGSAERLERHRQKQI